MSAEPCHDLPHPQAPTTAPLVAVVGNPNTGKTTLFNRLTGQRAKVGNYPGVTVDRRSGTMKLHLAEQRALISPHPPTALELVDVPGCYSLSARSGEEEIAIQALLGLGGNPRPDVALIVVDATQLVRNLYLVVQVLELGIPAVIALNMIDEAGDEPPDARALEAVLGVPCVPISARYGMGVPTLRARLAEAVLEPPHSAPKVDYPAFALGDLDEIIAALPSTWRADPDRDRALALWALLSIDEQDELVDVPVGLRRAVASVHQKATDAGRDLDLEVIGARYRWLDAHHEAFFRPPPPRNTTERVDRVLLHPVFGFVVFMAIMGTMFQALFTWSEPAIALIESGFGRLGELTRHLLPAGVLTDLLTNGIIAGVGSVVVFLPQILLLFFFIGLLEDSGYMSRAAYLMDRVMRALGLNGRAFVPMLSGFACAVPAILATRNMERQRDRFLTMMVVPLMTCSARLPVYTLIIATLFPAGHVLGFVPVQSGLMVAMYLFSTVIALAAAGILGRTVLKGPRVPLILELPPYRLPTLSAVIRMMWERAKSFLHEAGTMILACTVVLWALLSFPALPGDAPGHDASPAEVSAWQAATLEHSYGGRIGKAIEPAIAPLGFDWKIGVGVIGAFAAREVFVSTMGLVYGIGDEGVDENDHSLRERIRAEKGPDGNPRYSPLMGLSLMVFFALACQCVSTLSVVRRETRSWRWPIFLFTYMTTLAWTAAFAIYQGGRLLGFS